ncbi:hypothetical protein OROHE_006804 [Orobanche hederae]
MENKKQLSLAKPSSSMSKPSPLKRGQIKSKVLQAKPLKWAWESESELEPEAPIWIHDVFLSFRGEDTRASFTSHLYSALQNAGIKVFIDDNDLQRGDHISTSLSHGVWMNWKKIMKCRRTLGQVVVPVFYHLDPSEVRHQNGEFGIAFQSLSNKISNKEELNLGRAKKLVLSWKEALREAANIAGFVIVNSRNERMWGTGGGGGGIGKTTIAKAIYNKIGRNFQSRSFLANIREVAGKIDGQVSLQKQLLFDICKEVTIKIPNIESGKNTLKHKLCHRKVLIVLDDVNTLDQLNTFCGSRKWFGSGSIIIITTRDMRLLQGRVDKMYKMTIMNENESIELFSWNAFKQASPRNDFAEISRKIVEYSGGLPLVLEVLGSYLFDRGLTEWRCVLEKLRRIPNVQVQNTLRISYDGLNDDDDEQEIFLDIACFFIGMDRNDVILVLNDCGLSAEIGLSVLVERSLVTIDDRNLLGMHDLLRDMGREIIREKSPLRPEKRSRLWFCEDVIDVLSKQTVRKIKKGVLGLALKLPRADAKCFSTKAFENMKRLRLLQLDEVKLDGDFEYVSKDLRWLSWNGLNRIPANFYRENFVSIELENNNIVK